MNKNSHKGREKFKKFNCKFCGYKHEKQRDKCPTRGKSCDNCKGLKNINALNQSNNDGEDSGDQWLMALNNETDSRTATVTLSDIDVKFQLETAADVNTTCQKHVRQHRVSSTAAWFNMWNKTNLKPLGETFLTVKNPRTSSEVEIKFIVVPNGFKNLLGLHAIQEVGFITINKECIISQASTPQLGDRGEATLRIIKGFLPKYCRLGKFLLPFKTQ